MADRDEILKGLKKLIDKYYRCKSEHENLSEANVRGALIDPFFKLLGWDSENPNEYDRETYVRIGFVDITLKVDEKPAVFVEAKKFGIIPPRSESTVQIDLEGKKVIADWTDEERQVLNYAASVVDVKWAILTNFEMFRLFNAKTGETILNIERPEQYIEYIDEIVLLSEENVSNKNIDILANRPDRPEIDITFLELLKKWRLLLANNIYTSNKLDLHTLNLFVQRILDRLIIIRFAEDNWILNQPDQLKSAVYDPWSKSEYVKLSENLIFFFNRFDDFHNSKIFEKDQSLNDLIRTIDDRVLGNIIKELYFQSFRKFNSDVLGATYESYLSFKLELKDQQIFLKLESESKKGKGIFYTPPYIVDFIIENTLGYILNNFWASVKPLFDKKEYENALKEFNKINNIKILDPSCGSGSFLIKAHDLFLDYYKKYETEYRKTKKEFESLIKTGEKKPWEIIELDEKLKSVLKDHEKKILKNNIYGVDIDETAAEIASVNLMLRAMKRNEKLPLILYENIKVGNSLITGVDNKEELLEYSNEISLLIELRDKIRKINDPVKKEEYENKVRKLKDNIDNKLNNNLYDYSSKIDELKPFNWEIEFPEVFYDQNGTLKENAGFDVVIGNPPWGAELIDSEKKFISDYFCTVEYQHETYVAFMEKSFHLLKTDGYFGFITTSPWLTYYYFKKIRKLLIEETTLDNVILLRYMAFNNVTAETTIFTYKKSPINSDNRIKITALQKRNQFEEMEFGEVKQDYWKEKYETGFNVLFWDKLDLVDKLNKDSIKLESPDGGIAEVGVGIKPYQENKGTPKQSRADVDNRVFDSDHQIGPDYKPFIVGTNIHKYYIISPEGKWLKYGDWLAEPRRSVDFEHKKIVLRQTSPRIIASIDEDGYLNLNNVINVLINNENEIGYEYLLALLNSNVIDFMYKYLVPEDGKPFPEVKTVKIAELPIRLVSQVLHDKITNLINVITGLNYQKIDLINLLRNLILNLDQNKKNKMLKDYINPKKAHFYSVNLAKTRRLINDDEEGIIRNYYVKKDGEDIVLSLKCKNNSIKDILRLNIEDSDIRNFFHLVIYSQVFNTSKKYRQDKILIETLLNDIKIPKSVNTHIEDVKKIKELMIMLDIEYKKLIRDKYPKSPVKDLDLNEIIDQISKIDNDINNEVYAIFDLDDSEIKILEETISSN